MINFKKFNMIPKNTTQFSSLEDQTNQGFNPGPAVYLAV